MDITYIIIGVICVTIGAVTAFVIPFIRSKMTTESFARLEAIVATAVRAAEQIYRDMEKAGAEKKKYVLEYIEKLGLKIDTEVLDSFIEAAVYKLKNK